MPKTVFAQPDAGGWQSPAGGLNSEACRWGSATRRVHSKESRCGPKAAAGDLYGILCHPRGTVLFSCDAAHR